MSHHIYNTTGFILGSTPVGEASSYIYIFTKDLGLVGARAQSARSINSKLRYSLDAPAKSQVSLVRGKTAWRLTNAAPEKNFYHLFKDQPEKLKLCARVLALLKRLLAGEEANSELFLIIEDFINYLESAHLSSDQVRNVEAIIALRILYNLGYLSKDIASNELVSDGEWTPELLLKAEQNRVKLVQTINESLRAADL